MTALLWIVLALALVLMNAFFVAAEFGMVKLRHTRVLAIEKVYGFRGKILKEVHQHLDAYLSACQLGITLASLGLGWVGEPAFARIFEPVFQLLFFASPQLAQAAGLTLTFLFITFLHIIVGELMPKSLAIRNAEKFSLWTAIPLYSFYWLMYPVIWFMNNCSNYLLKLLRLIGKRDQEHFYSTDEMKLIFSSSYRHGQLTKEESDILEHTLELGDLMVTDVMRPVDEMIALNVDVPIDESLKVMMRHRYSRYPVYRDNLETVIGIVHVKDVLSMLYQQKSITSLRAVMRPVLKVTRLLPALDLLRKFREGMPHFALVYTGNEEGLIGFVTLDNLLHVLVGRIKDEFHRTRDDWLKLTDGSFVMPGNASIYSLERALKINIDDEVINDDVDTLAGLVFSRLETMPKTGQLVKFNNFNMIVEKIRGHRILQLRVYPVKQNKNES